MSMDGQGTKRRRKIAENFNRLSRVHQRYRQTDRRQTYGTAITYSEREREREFTLAKNGSRDSDQAILGVMCHRRLGLVQSTYMQNLTILASAVPVPDTSLGRQNLKWVICP